VLFLAGMKSGTTLEPNEKDNRDERLIYLERMYFKSEDEAPRSIEFIVYIWVKISHLSRAFLIKGG